jgi:hypothetical protein
MQGFARGIVPPLLPQKPLPRPLDHIRRPFTLPAVIAIRLGDRAAATMLHGTATAPRAHRQRSTFRAER